MITRIGVARHEGRHRVDLVGGLLRPQVVLDRPDRLRIGLVATTALLLGGDEVELEVRLGPEARLELFDVAGTVAYHGRGRAAAWRTTITLAERARLRYDGAPFVVSEGADVERTLDLDLDSTSGAWLRETVVLGRSGEIGGRLRSRMAITVGGRPALLEDQILDPSGIRRSPGMLGTHRVIDTLLAVGTEAAGPDGSSPAPGAAVRFSLVGDVGSITRYLGADVAASPLEPKRV
ncbi:MAG TPA: urease accessory protein UreD [Propionibacteriaceae bacterium]|nr:urease accessory protein UreD [Propionibacteriaceae bacterium]